ncbi:MAG: hypothetical protein KAQ94_03900 [Arcobacteraceae bacterium]|nr:hypothetical protein [Arcobacteraceae bacterium]
MEITVLALEKLIEENRLRIANTEKQLKDFTDGITKLSPVKQGSLENSLEAANAEYTKYKNMYSSIPKAEIALQKETVRVQQALAKQTYYKLQKIRLKRNKNLKRNQLLEAMMILDELPDEVNYDDSELVSLSDVVLRNNIREVTVLEKEFDVIKSDFTKRVDALPDDKDLKHFLFLDSYIPIVILHFSILVQNIIESIDEYNESLGEEGKENPKKKTFSGLPKYEDWWIEELFKNHQAYFGLYKWKDIINNICITPQQHIIWDKVFNNWLMIKKILNSKDENSYDYNYIFDELICKYAQLEEELEDDNLKSMETIVCKITIKEDFTKMREEHNINTTYSQWKKRKDNN